ncbi:MAG TPA: alpha/beta fold hydrolase [Mycobacteriales bacterium]|nr:alpha/beta fold hydrolase [Mycobacteriales bacterium]
MASPTLVELTLPSPVHAVALVLHGGREHSFETAHPSQLTAVRMRPFARALQRRGSAAGLAVAALGYRFRGWNGAEESPVADARWALAELRDRHGDLPVILVGHSMGGRTALRVADDIAVAGVVALAPWLPPKEPVSQLAAKRILIAHGNLDFVTSPRASRHFADRARRAGADVTYVTVHGDNHAMLLRPGRWHRLVARTALDFARPL